MTLRQKGRPIVLGLAASHNGGACLLIDGVPVVAIQEERLTRKKRDRTYGSTGCLSIRYCLGAAGVSPDDIDLVVVCTTGPQASAVHNVARNPVLGGLARSGRVRFLSHHLGHALSAYAMSGFDQAVILVADGVGSPAEDLLPEESSLAPADIEDPHEALSVYSAEGGTIKPLFKQFVAGGRWLLGKGRGMPYFGSLGGMYSASAQQIFGQYSEAGKVMGLAPLGSPGWTSERFWDWSSEGFQFLRDLPELFNHDDRWPGRQEEHAALAASVQEALEAALLLLCREVAPGRPYNFCYAGGVALNSIANQKLADSGLFRGLFIQPAAEDNGTAIGAAYYGWWALTGGHALRPARMMEDFLGRPYSERDIKIAAASCGRAEAERLDDPAKTGAALLDDGEIIGWFQGGSEFGPRALGHRSLLADPRKLENRIKLNRHVKQREEFRPFAPSILEEEYHRFFNGGGTAGAQSPFMLFVRKFTNCGGYSVPAVCHVDGSARVQTVPSNKKQYFRQLIEEFHDLSGVPMVLNTSFNRRGEPLVETPLDAITSARKMGLTYCILGNTLVRLVN